MVIAATSILLAGALTFAGVRKLSHRPDVVDAYARAGVPEGRLNQLAIGLFAAAAGLVAGLVWRPVGVAAASGLIVYFAVAVAFHVRAGDWRGLPVPVALWSLSVATLALQLSAA